MTKLFVSLLFSALLSGCISSGTLLLVHPKSGERITCQGRTGHPVLDAHQASNCAGQYEALGFIRAENLTAEQKEQISKPTAQRIEQDITIRK